MFAKKRFVMTAMTAAAVSLAATWVLADPPTNRKTKKTPSIVSAVTKANKLLDRMTILDDSTHATIKESGYLDGFFRVKLRFKKLDSTEGDQLAILGTIRVKRGDKIRYRTEEENEKITGLVREIAKQKDHIRELEYGTYKQQPRTRGRRHESSVVSTARKELKELQKVLARVTRRVNASAAERQKLLETIDVRVVYSEGARGCVDIQKLVEQTKFDVVGVIHEYGLASEPDEIGGHPRFASITILGSRIDPDLLKAGVAKDHRFKKPKVNPPVITPQAAAEGEKPSAAADEADPIVYVTKSGTKYHRAGCPSLRKSAIQKRLSEVRGVYRPCAKCRPPR